MSPWAGGCEWVDVWHLENMRDILLQTRVTSALKLEVGEEHCVTLKQLP